MARRAFFLFLSVFVGNVVFSFPRQRRLSVIGVCRRLVVFSSCFSVATASTLRVFCVDSFLKSRGPWISCVGFATKLCFVVSLRKTLASTRESGRLDGVLLRSTGFASGGRSSAEALGIGLGDAG